MTNIEIFSAKVDKVEVILKGHAFVETRITFVYDEINKVTWETLIPHSNWKMYKLMEYTGSGDGDIYALKGAAVRIFMCDNYFRGFAHASEDKFVPVYGWEEKEVDMLRLMAMLQNS